MKHDINEIYEIKGICGVYSEDYLDKYFVKTAKDRWTAKEGEAARLTFKEASKGTLNIHTANGIKVVYMFGGYVFFDTYEELLEAREERQKKFTESARRKAALEKLNKLSTKNLEKLVTKLGL